MTDEEIKVIQAKLAEELPYYWRAGQGNMHYAYVDARQVADRLNEVVGLDGWSSYMTIINDYAVRCDLTLHFGDRSVTRSDVGYSNNPLNPADMSDLNGLDPDRKRKLEAEPLKAAASDALKRAAVQFGIGAFLYNLEPQRQKPAPGQVVPLKRAVNPTNVTPQVKLWGILQAKGTDGPTANKVAKESYGVAFNKLTDEQARDWLSKVAA